MRVPTPAALVFLCDLLCAAATLAQSPTLTGIAPSARTDLTSNTVTVQLTGTGFTAPLTLVFNPPGMITADPVTPTTSTSATVSLTITNKAVGTVNVSVQAAGVSSPKSVPFDTGVQCLEALQSGGCQLRWEFEATGATGRSSQSSSSTAPNFLSMLDYQWRAPRAAAAQSMTDRLAAHMIFRTGYTQAISATRLQPAASPAAAVTTVTAIPQPAFVVEAGSTVGWSIGRDGQGGAFAELGFGARGVFEDLSPVNQIVETGGLPYVDLSANNPQTLAGLYEGTAHFTVSSWNHNQPASAGGSYHNVSNLLTIELGYQNNSGLQLLGSRARFVGRVSLTPELPNSSHTKLTLGMEYSAGISGGPKIVQIFFGTNLNPAKLFSPNSSSIPAN